MPAARRLHQSDIQYDLAGGWVPIVHEDGNNRAAGGEYEILAGLPLNDAARMRWEAFNEEPDLAARVSVPAVHLRRTRCEPLTRFSGSRPSTRQTASGSSRSSSTSSTSAILLGGTRTIYLDGRPHPSPLAPHSFGGFSTGTWDGNMLNVETTHLKAYYTQRPGVPASDERTVSEHWVRHGDLLTMTWTSRTRLPHRAAGVEHDVGAERRPAAGQPTNRSATRRRKFRA